MTDARNRRPRVVQIKPSLYAVVGYGLVYRAGPRWWMAKPIVLVDEDGVWWGPDIGLFESKREAVDALVDGAEAVKS